MDEKVMLVEVPLYDNPVVDFSREVTDSHDNSPKEPGTPSPVDDKVLSRFLGKVSDKPRRVRRRMEALRSEWFVFLDSSLRVPGPNPSVEEQLRAMEDARDLMWLVLELKAFADGDGRYGDVDRESVVSLLDSCEDHAWGAGIYYLARSDYFVRYLRTASNVELHEFRERGRSEELGYETPFRNWDGQTVDTTSLGFLVKGEHVKRFGFHLPSQEETAKGLKDDGEYPVVYFPHYPYKAREGTQEEMAHLLMDEIMSVCLRNVTVWTDEGLPRIRSRDIFTNLWLMLSLQFRGRYLGYCKSCGSPILIERRKRGSKREYCSDSCKQMHHRAMSVMKKFHYYKLKGFPDEEAMGRALRGSCIDNESIGSLLRVDKDLSADAREAAKRKIEKELER